jgi:hypothetical protein
MKKIVLFSVLILFLVISAPAFSQAKDSKTPEDTTAALGLAGDNLDLYAVLTLFQKSKTIEAFEKSLNDEKEKINNLDLNLDKKVDFIKVTTKKKDSSYTFVLQVDVSKKETQDVAVILLDKDKTGKISMQIVGDEELYGKDYVIEPKGNSAVTANPGYTGDNPVTVNVPATTTVVVQSAPIVQYVYSPAYVPYAPPYYYGYYPPWFGFATVMAVGIYRSNHYYGHGGYYGGHYHGGNNNVIINNGNRNNFNNYNNNKMRSNTVANNKANGSYGNGAGAANRERTGSTRPSAGTSDRGGAGSRPSGGTSNRPSAGTSDRGGGGGSRNSPSASTRQTPSTSNRSSNYSSPSRSSSSSYGGGGRSMSGGGGGGFSRGGGGGGGRRR